MSIGESQWHSQAALTRHSHDVHRSAHRPCRPRTVSSGLVCVILTKYGQPPHNALPFGTRGRCAVVARKPACNASVPQFGHVLVFTTRVGIANAPTATGRLRV
jgi:hypothetical protein